MYMFLDSISISKITLFVNVIRCGTFRLFRFGFNCGSRLFHKRTEMTNFYNYASSYDNNLFVLIAAVAGSTYSTEHSQN